MLIDRKLIKEIYEEIVVLNTQKEEYEKMLIEAIACGEFEGVKVYFCNTNKRFSIRYKDKSGKSKAKSFKTSVTAVDVLKYIDALVANKEVG